MPAGDFRAYLQLLVDSGKRSRTILIFIIALVVLEVSIIKNTYYPDWTGQRIKTGAMLYDCYSGRNVFRESCANAILSIQYNNKVYNYTFVRRLGKWLNTKDDYVKPYTEKTREIYLQHYAQEHGLYQLYTD